MSLSILYVMLHVNFHHQPQHQQNHNVHVHGKVTVTAMSVQNICAKLKKCAHLEGAGSCDCVVQWSAVRTTMKLVIQTTKACEAGAASKSSASGQIMLYSWQASATRNPTHWHCSNAATATLQFITSVSKKSLMFNNFTLKIISNSILILFQSV